jgi:hypothetical protein
MATSKVKKMIVPMGRLRKGFIGSQKPIVYRPFSLEARAFADPIGLEGF